MKAARIHQFGPAEVVVIDDLSRPYPDQGELLVRVRAAGVGPWDALIREGKSNVSPPPPLTLGSDLSGTVENIGPGVTDFRVGEEVYGVTDRKIGHRRSLPNSSKRMEVGERPASPQFFRKFASAVDFLRARRL